ncbi:MAG: Nif3-like dinuclear metal center hexameric protein, partial [Planctomycetes bacterium]|nr:Nif3-like dinuclear metal center hexameric protein [Planctomycetota bacterium]
IESLAPLALAQDWDNVGLLLGDAEADVQSVLMCIDTTAAVVDEAIRMKADLILSYHPVMFDGVKRLTAQGPSAHLYKLIQRGIGLYSFHTAMDVAAGGVNDALAEAIGIQDPKPLGDFVEAPDGPHYKVIAFVPQKHVTPVAQAMYEAGAGRIGHYAQCGFQTEGTGTFMPLDQAKPFVGQRGKLEQVQEIRLETVVHAACIQPVVAALRGAHPYETPAFDVLKHHDVEQKLGLGRVGLLEQPVRLDAILDRLKTHTLARTVGIIGPQKKTYAKAAVCAGSCGKILFQALAQACDLYVTGELRHHTALAAQEAGLTCLCLSHSVSERFALKKIMPSLKKRLPHVKMRVSRCDRDPFEWKTL